MVPADLLVIFPFPASHPDFQSIIDEPWFRHDWRLYDSPSRKSRRVIL